MGMSDFYGAGDDDESTATIHRALDLGVTFLDTSDMYGPFTNEQLVGKAIKGRRDEVTVATKFGIVRFPGEPTRRAVRGDAAYVREACDASLRAARHRHHRPVLRAPHRSEDADRGDHRRDGRARRAEARCATSGCPKPRRDTLRRAHAVHPIAALQSEWSLWSRDLETEMVGVARELGVGIVPYSPLGRGFLTGQITSTRRLRTPTTSGATARASWARTSPRTSTSSTRCASSRPRRAARPDSSRWRGCSPRATTSCRSRARNVSGTSKRTSARSTSR